ncbi:hypothetical protein GCM10023238_31780 [Streptomyces heliomycini]
MGDFLRAEIAAGRTYLPAGANVLRAFQQPFDEVRVLIVGQDPYPTPGHAVGLSFSVAPEVRPLPGSLINIFRELGTDLGLPSRPTATSPPGPSRACCCSTALTTAPRKPGAHRGKGWEEVTEQAIRALAGRGKPLVSILWGRDARNCRPLLGDLPAVESAHPSPMSADRGFFGSRPFSRANDMLIGRAGNRWTGACRDRARFPRRGLRGSGLRVAVGAGGRGPLARAASGEPVRTGGRGIDPGHFVERLVPMARALCAEAGIERLEVAVVGAAGLAGLGDALRAELPDALRRELGVRRAALAADAVTAYVGALRAAARAVIAAGTGLIAIGTDLTGWRRADGWGHLLGDCGGGAWIGRAGLEAALRAHDGRRGGSARLLAGAEDMFGPAAGLPGRLYPRTDRPAVLASFAPRVGACAADGDPVAVRVLRAAARHMADSAAAVCPAADAPVIGLTGGLFRMGAALLDPLDEELPSGCRGCGGSWPRETPCTGRSASRRTSSPARSTLPGDEKMLCVTGPAGEDVTRAVGART